MSQMATGFFAELHKLAAPADNKSSGSKSQAQAPAMPPSPMEAENEQLRAMLENLSLKMQVRQAQQALSAAQQQDAAAQQQAEAEQEMALQQQAQQKAQEQVMGKIPVVQTGQPPAQATPDSPQAMVGR